MSQTQRSGSPIRLLVLDFTPAGDGTATGELKAAIFYGLGDVPIMQVSQSGEAFQYAFPNDQPGLKQPAGPADLLIQLDWFAPTVILARPTIEAEPLWLLALALRARYDIPVLVWLMDDWLSMIGEPARRKAFEDSLAEVFAQTGHGLSICDEMSEAFGARFGIPFTAIANGIDPDGEFARFSPRVSDPDTPFVLRYAGALAHNMGVDTLESVARTVCKLRRDGVDICLEIKSRPYWLEQQGARFAGLEGVQASATAMARYPYLTWLSEADCNLICYNFSDSSKRYVRFSLANKLPELLGVGAPLLGIGPAELPTIARIRDLGAGFHLSNPHPEAIERCLHDLVVKRHALQAVARRGCDVAARHFNLHDIRARFLDTLQQVVAGHTPLGKDAGPATLRAARGFDAALAGFDLAEIARPTVVPAGAGRIETPPRVRGEHAHADDGRSDPVPPRPTRETAGLSGTVEPLVGFRRRLPQSAPLSGRQAAQASLAAGLPLALDRPVSLQRPWLAPKEGEAKAFSKAARDRARQFAANLDTADASPATERETIPEEAFQPVRWLRIEARNGALLAGHNRSGFVIERNGAPSAEHAVLVPELEEPVKGLRVEISAIQGKAELQCGGEVLLWFERPGRYDLVFPRPRRIHKIGIRCRDSLRARLSVRVFLQAPAKETAPTG